MNAEAELIQRIVDRLAGEEQQLKKLGMVNHAAGVRVAIVAVLKLRDEGKPSPDQPDESA